jgi:trehalose-6-phosphatase
VTWGPLRAALSSALVALDFDGKGTAIRELVSDDPAAAFYAGDDLGDLPAIHEVNAWAERSGRPTLTVGVSSRGSGPIAEQTDVTVADPQGLISLLRQILPNAADSAAVTKG